LAQVKVVFGRLTRSMGWKTLNRAIISSYYKQLLYLKATSLNKIIYIYFRRNTKAT